MPSRLKTIVAITGLGERDARAAAGVVPSVLRREPGVTAEAAWDPAASALRVTVEADVQGSVTDADEAANFDRVWRTALACIPGSPPHLRFDIEGSLEVPPQG